MEMLRAQSQGQRAAGNVARAPEMDVLSESRTRQRIERWFRLLALAGLPLVLQTWVTTRSARRLLLTEENHPSSNQMTNRLPAGGLESDSESRCRLLPRSSVSGVRRGFACVPHRDGRPRATMKARMERLRSPTGWPGPRCNAA